MPGWGESDPVSYQERNHPLAVAHLLDELDISTATLIGNSMGGGTTIRFGYEYPDRVKRLITMGSSSGRTIFGAGGFTERLKVLQQGYRDPTFDTSKKLVGIMTFDASFATDELIQQRADNVAATLSTTRISSTASANVRSSSSTWIRWQGFKPPRSSFMAEMTGL